MSIRLKQPINRQLKCAFCSFFSGNSTDLTESELIAFYRLKEIVNRPLVPSIAQVRFRYLYELYFQQKCPQSIVSKRWLKLGFQGERPETDLRGAGFMGLQLIIRFVEMERLIVDSMAQPQNDFFFALASINVSYWLKMYFHLSTDDKADGNWQRCGRRTLKKFGMMLASNQESFGEMHRLCLLFLYLRIWMRMKYEGNNVTLTHFNLAFQQLAQRIRRTMKREITCWDAFEAYWLYSQ